MESSATICSELFSPDGRTGGGSTRCQLVVIEGPDMGRAVPLDAERLVGTRECDLLLSDARVSRRHLSVPPEAGGFVVRDLGPSNGTHYEGSRITEATVPAGATLRLGNSYLRIQPRPEPLTVEPSQARRFGELVAESLAMREI